MVKKKWTACLRVWHWINALLVFGMGITGLLISKGGDFKEAFLQPHIIAGFVLCAMLVVRVARILFFGDNRTFKDALELRKKAFKYLRERGVPKSREAFHLFHKAGVKNGYAVVYLLLAGMVATGIVMVVLFQMGVEPEVRHIWKELHEAFFWILAIFVPLHIGGVVMAELSDEPNITSDMINGGKE